MALDELAQPLKRRQSNQNHGQNENSNVPRLKIVAVKDPTPRLRPANLRDNIRETGRPDVDLPLPPIP
ncbi:MAG: hypothetical protein MK108_08125 [Mariniblastus sp.]|nr:hypothetical protein [Mariniblastus sp.]